MALTKAQKTEQLAELKERMQRTQSLMLANYIGLKVSEVSDLRAKLRKEKSEMKVAKKSLMQLAAKELSWPELPDELLTDAVACIFSFEDPLSGAQIAYKYGKTHPQVQLIGGVFEGKLINKQEAMAIAQIPGKMQLLGMFAAMINTPLTSFAIGLSEIAKQKAEPEVKKEEAPAPVVEAPAPVAEAPAAPETPAAEAAPTPVAETPSEVSAS